MCALHADLCIDILPCQLLLCGWLLLIRGKQHQLPVCNRHELLDDLQSGLTFQQLLMVLTKVGWHMDGDAKHWPAAHGGFEQQKGNSTEADAVCAHRCGTPACCIWANVPI